MYPHHRAILIICAVLTALTTRLGFALPVTYSASRDVKISPTTFTTSTSYRISNVSSLSPHLVSRANSKAKHFIFVTLETEVTIPSCVPNIKEESMCTFVYAQKSTWKDWGKIWVYDNECYLMGESNYVAREWLASRWSFASKLRYFADIKIPRSWAVEKLMGLEIWYGSHYSQPFVYTEYTTQELLYRNRIASKTSNETYMVARAPFNCEN
ncbi:uncharacterized protein RSE6_14870 [Rhynchosporium secalis]|uniref:Uncharacterized protein n=1 Tax=Rhynchosporium secalis TaxID=38038 RepID=A0A1E1MWD7_RHYSE|nr:uncharacterized protein RSE6_14870 [Rhynchosporium secalis]